MTTRVVATDAHEGPVFVEDENALYFTSVPHRNGGPPVVAIKRLDIESGRISIVQAEANVANGMTLDSDGSLLVCEQGSMSRPAQISRFDSTTGNLEPVVDAYEGRPFNSPNDIVVKSDRTIWFTDPSYGWLQGFRPGPCPDRVYRFDGRLTTVSDEFDKPNGLAFSPDERVLYVGDSGAIHAPDDYDPDRPRRVTAFDVVGGRLENERVFADEIPGFPDGLKVDPDGRVFVSCSGGVRVFAPGGEPLGEIELPGAVNFAFGATPDVLYVTTDDALWAAVLDLKGA
jgi:gluconolactonase